MTLASGAWLRSSIFFQILLLVYLEVVEWIDLFPWNNIRQGNDQAALHIALGAVMAILIVLAMLRIRLGLALGVVVYLLGESCRPTGGSSTFAAPRRCGNASTPPTSRPASSSCPDGEITCPRMAAILCCNCFWPER